MIQVLLVDQQQLFSEAIQSLLETEENIQVIGNTTTGTEAIQLTVEHEPDVILMDLDLPISTSINAALHLKENYPEIKIIFLTSIIREEPVVAAMATGADGFLLKNLEADHLIQAIHDAYHDQVVISGDVAQILASKIAEVEYSKHEILKKQLANHDIYLTDRELDIAVMVMDGMRNKQIAKELYLSEGTIKNYISELYDKFNLRNRNHVIAFLRGLFSRYYY